MPKTKTYYWDACAWLGLINQESKKHRELEIIWKAAENGDCRIITSTLSQVEVFKKRCEDNDPKPLSEEADKEIAGLFQQPHIDLAALDPNIAETARGLRRKHALKAPDSIHLATAAYWNCDVMQTYDRDDLLVLDGKVMRRDGKSLAIAIPDATVDGPLFASLKDLSEDEK